MIERSIIFGEGNGLVGTICMPSPQSVNCADFGFILFNAGVVHRIGPHRINVRLGRKLSARGIPSIRFDLAGQGDSPRPTSLCTSQEQVVIDLRSAMDALATYTGVRRFALFGFCSGGYHGYDLALVDDRIHGLLMFDAYIYPTARARINLYRMRIRQHGLLKAVGGGAGRRISAAIQRTRAVPASGNNVRQAATAAYSIGLPSKSDFASGLKTLLARGVNIHLLYAGEGLEHYNYERQFEDAFRKFGIADRVTTAFFPDMDHVATGINAQATFLRRIEEWAVDLSVSGNVQPDS